jgi:hypothetical protein
MVAGMVDGLTILPYIHKKTDTYKMCVDQGFPRSEDAALISVGPISHSHAQRLAPALHLYLLFVSNVHVSLCQASECVMRGLQGSFFSGEEAASRKF